MLKRNGYSLNRYAMLVSLLGLHLCFGGTALALPSLNPSTSPDVRQSIDPSAWDDANLKEAVSLLKEGKRAEAKQKLAAHLKRSPKDPRGLDVAGLIFLEEKKYQVAIASFREALRLNPTVTAARAKLGVALMLNNNVVEGEKELRRVLETHPTDAFARRYLGWLDESRGHSVSAIGHYQMLLRGEAIAKDSLTEIHATLARLYNQTGQYAETVNLLEPIIDKTGVKQLGNGARMLLGQAYAELGLNKQAEGSLKALRAGGVPKNDMAMRILAASVARANSNFSESLRELDALRKENPGADGLVRLQSAKTYMAQGDWRKALQQLDGAVLEQDQMNAVLLANSMANIAFEKHAASTVIPTFEKLVKKFPDAPNLAILLAQAKIENNDLAGAGAVLNALRSTHANYAPLYYTTGLLHFLQNRPADAAGNFQKAAALQPNYVQAWTALIGMQLGQKKIADAEKSIQNGLAAVPNNPDLLAQRGIVLEAQGKVDQANTVYRQILDATPNNITVMRKLALNLADAGKEMPTALALSEKAYTLVSTDPLIADLRGWVLMRSGDVKRGLPLLESAAKNLPNDGAVVYHLGAAYLKVGKAAEGKELLLKAQKLDVSPAIKSAITALLK